MSKLLISLVAGVLASSQAAFAAERTVTLAVNGMYCEACPYMVKKTLTHVSGVSNVIVSFKDRTALVGFDDAKASVTDLTNAVTKAGFPSQVKG